jgi:transcriptional regulator with XRE-family HTH domain
MRLLGARVRLERKTRRMTVEQLAERVGVSRVSIEKVERGDPTVALGTAFEAAVILGVVLFHHEADRLRLEVERVDGLLALLPQSIRLKAVDDDF